MSDLNQLEYFELIQLIGWINLIKLSCPCLTNLSVI